MQANYGELFNEPEDFDQEKLSEHLERGASLVEVFTKNSPEHARAIMRHHQMTKNQKKRLRKKQKR